MDDKVKAEADAPKDMMERTISLTVKLKEFSDESVHMPGRLTTDSNNSFEDTIIKSIIGSYYGNGNKLDNMGYVSMGFNCYVPLIFQHKSNFNFFCEIAVEDVVGNNRFLRTFTFLCDDTENDRRNLYEKYIIDRYIARDTILNNRDELLIDDQLTLKIYINLQRISKSDNFADTEFAINSSFEIEEDSGDPILALNLNSEIAKQFYEVSSVFRAMCDSPMLESSTRIVRLLDDDKDVFKSASRIIMGAKAITFNSFDEIESLYIFADKYDIQNVIRACRHFFKEILNAENSLRFGRFDLTEERADKISELGTKFNDDVLLEIADSFLKNGKVNNLQTGMKCSMIIDNILSFDKSPSYSFFSLNYESDDIRNQYESDDIRNQYESDDIRNQFDFYK